MNAVREAHITGELAVSSSRLASERLKWLGNRAVATGIATVISLGLLTPTTSDADTISYNTRVSSGTSTLVQEGLGDVARLGYPTDDGCSALVLELDGQNVGALSAGHCVDVNPNRQGPPLKDPTFGKWIKGANGEYYLDEIGDDNIVQTGSSSNAMKTVGTVQEVLASTNGDTDQVVMVFKGHTEAQALQAYDAELIDQSNIAKLATGDSVYVGGWPLVQNGDGHGNLLRQFFAATFVKEGIITTDTNKNMKVAWLAFPKNKDGASCTNGFSGAGAFTPVETAKNRKSLAVIGSTYGDPESYSSVNPNDPGAPPIVRQNPTIINWSNYDTVCAIAQTRLTEGDITVLHMVGSASSVSGKQQLDS